MTMHDLTACRFCGDINVKWKIVFELSEHIEFAVCDDCVDYVLYLDKAPLKWDDVKIFKLPTNTEILLDNDYFMFMRYRANDKLKKKKNDRREKSNS